MRYRSVRTIVQEIFRLTIEIKYSRLSHVGIHFLELKAVIYRFRAFLYGLTCRKHFLEIEENCVYIEIA